MNTLKKGFGSVIISIIIVSFLLTLLSFSNSTKAVNASPDTATIILDANGGYFTRYPDGSAGEPTVVSKSAPIGTSIFPLIYEQDIKNSDEKMLLVGWSEDKDYQFKYDIYSTEKPYILKNQPCPIDGDKTYYAVWSSIVDITFDANGGAFDDGTTVKQKRHVAGDQFSSTSGSPNATTGAYMDYSLGIMDGTAIATKEGALFAGWSTKKDDAKGEFININVPDTETTLYAVWAKKITITLDGNGFAIAGKNVKDGITSFQFPAGTKLGNRYIYPVYKKGGIYPDDVVEVKWALDREGKKIISDITEFSTQDDVTLYAIAADAVMALAGDVNGDQKVDSKDLTTLAKHVAKIALITDPALLQAADVNGDDKIDSKDLTHLAKYVAKIIPAL